MLTILALIALPVFLSYVIKLSPYAAETPEKDPSHGYKN